MATLPEDLRTFITGTTAITGLVSTRVHFNMLPQASAYPHIWYRVVSDNEPLTMDGAGGLHQAFVDIECAGLTPQSVQALADAVKARLHGYKGAMGSSTCNGAFLDNKDDDYAPFSNESDEGVSVAAYSLNLWYTT